jgi:hypothetical protein
MPTVPIYDNLRTSVGPAPDTAPRGPGAMQITGQQMAGLGESLQRAGGGLQSMLLDEVQQANQVRVTDAMNQAVAARLRRTHDQDEGFSALAGRSALDRPDGKPLDLEFSAKLKGDIDRIGASLGNDAQRRVFQQQSAQMLAAFQADVQQHMAREGKAYRISTAQGTIKVAQDMAAMEWQRPEALAQAQGAIKAGVADLGRVQGWAPEEVAARTVEQLSPAHSAVITQALQSGQVDYARAYMDQVKAELTPAARLQLAKHIQEGDRALKASNGADAIWQQFIPTDDKNAPIDQFAMEKAARAAAGQDADLAKSMIDELRQRAGAWNASQREAHAANTTAVYRLLDSGQSLSKVRASSAWQSLPGDQQHRITLSLEQEAAARESRAAAAESRAFTRMQRNDAAKVLLNADAYVRYGDPNVLAGMSRREVEALRPVFGLEGTQHLLQRFDNLQKPGKLAEARIDTQDFNFIADQMGLKPFDPRKTEADRKGLGELQFKVEQLIDRAQQMKRAPLERQEKMELMRQEMARTVAVPTWFGMSSKEVPVIQLGADDARRVVVPAADRQQIVQALRTMAQRDPANPAFQPTEDNVRRLYLTRRSPAANLTTNGQ